MNSIELLQFKELCNKLLIDIERFENVSLKNINLAISAERYSLNELDDIDAYRCQSNGTCKECIFYCDSNSTAYKQYTISADLVKRREACWWDLQYEFIYYIDNRVCISLNDMRRLKVLGLMFKKSGLKLKA